MPSRDSGIRACMQRYSSQSCSQVTAAPASPSLLYEGASVILAKQEPPLQSPSPPQSPLRGTGQQHSRACTLTLPPPCATTPPRSSASSTSAKNTLGTKQEQLESGTYRSGSQQHPDTRSGCRLCQTPRHPPSALGSLHSPQACKCTSSLRTQLPPCHTPSTPIPGDQLPAGVGECRVLALHHAGQS